MNEIEQRIAIAEACGWKSDGDDYTHPTDDNGFRDDDGCWHGVPPDYLHDLNAMQEAKKVLTVRQSEVYICTLADMISLPSAFHGTARGAFLIGMTKAAQCAEAFLKTIGKWDEPAKEKETK